MIVRSCLYSGYPCSSLVQYCQDKQGDQRSEPSWTRLLCWEQLVAEESAAHGTLAKLLGVSVPRQVLRHGSCIIDAAAAAGSCPAMLSPAIIVRPSALAAVGCTLLQGRLPGTVIGHERTLP